MKTIEELENELLTAYENFDYRDLHTWSEARIRLRIEELLELQRMLYAGFGPEAKEANLIISCELYDLEDELIESPRHV